MIARKHDAIARPQQSRIGQTSSPPRYCFQAWYSGEKPVSEALYHNEAMASFIREHLKHLKPELAQVLHIRPATPKQNIQSHVTPRTVYVSVQRNGDPEVDEKGFIAVFRDEYYGKSVAAFSKKIEKTLEFYNCFVNGPGGPIPDHFSMVKVRKGFYGARNKLQLQKQESWGDIGTGLAQSVQSFPIHRVATAISNIQSLCGSQKSGVNDQPAELSSTTADNSIETVSDALKAIYEWLKAQLMSTPVTAEVRTAQSFCQFEETSRQFIGLLKTLTQACNNAQEKGNALSLSEIWRSLESADLARRHGEDFILNLNQTGLLNTVLGKHSATKSTAYAAGCFGGLGVAGYGVAVLSGWPMITVLAVGCITALLTGHQSLKHKKCADQIRKVEVDLASFREALDAVTRTLAIQLLTLSGVEVTIQNRELRDNIMRDIGMDARVLNEEDYTIASLSVRVEHLEQTFSKFIDNMDWINGQEDLGLRRA